MEGVIVLLLILCVVFFVLPIIALVRANKAANAIAGLRNEIDSLRLQLSKLSGRAVPSDLDPSLAAKVAATPPVTPSVIRPAAPSATPPPLPAEYLAAKPAAQAAAPRPTPQAAPAPKKASPVVPRPAINWEQFMGAKLFAWI